jgi:tRNA (cmo5U34)-methyltransferase
MDKIRQHFDHEAAEFDRIIVRLIPHYATMVEALVAAVPFAVTTPIRVVDLGCGTGTIARRVLERFPDAHVTCVDLADNMIALAKAKLHDFRQVRYVVGDFNHFEFDAAYDLVISALALHHLVTDQDKRNLYRKIFASLNPGGVFYNADVVLASTDHLQALSMRQWQKFMLCSVSEVEIDEQWIPKYQTEDHPAKLTDQLSWMTEIGFAGVDVLWKYYNFAVYGGVRACASGRSGTNVCGV